MSLFIICQSTPAYDCRSFPYFPYMKAKSALPKDHCGVPASARQEGIGGQGIGAAWWWQCGQCGECGVARKKMRDRQDLSPCQTREVPSANVFLQFPSVSRILLLLQNLVTARGVRGGGGGIGGKTCRSCLC